MEVSESSKVENDPRESLDGSGEVEVEEVGSGEAIVFPPEAGELEKEAESLSFVSGNEQKVEEAEAEAAVASNLPVSDANVEASPSGVAGSEEKEVDDGVPPQVLEIPKGTTEEDEPATSTTLTHETRTSWRNCCGLLDVLRGSNQ